MQRGTTSWDEETEVRVEHGEPEVWRFILLAITMVAMALGIGVIFSLTPEAIEAMKAMQGLSN